ncbi:hypothetical protein Tco_0706773 [Tanacetum coccineum]|uniref:Uncharacterized protein n=1 Tax=Tanacetum coccineum TaxID=301880 RepID=A0ABQ4YAL3_9ASTR
MEIPDTMISDAIKKSAGYNFYIAKKKESAKDKIVVEPKEQHVSRIKSGRGKAFMCYGDQAVNVPKKDVVLRKTRSLTIAEEIVVGPVVEDPAVQSLLDLQKGSKASRLENTDSDEVLYSLCSEESENETDDADDSDMDLSDDNPQGDDDAARFGVFMYNKSTEAPNSTYFSPTVTSSLLDFIQMLLNETPANEFVNTNNV